MTQADFFTIPIKHKGTTMLTKVSLKHLEAVMNGFKSLHIQKGKKNKTYYVQGYLEKDNSQMYLHRFLMGLEKGDKRQVDHWNGCGLDNRDENLRFCSNQQNQFNQSIQSNNTSGCKGVNWLKNRNKWRAQIKFNGKMIHLGLFATKAEAYAAYCTAARELFGEFANFGNFSTNAD